MQCLALIIGGVIGEQLGSNFFNAGISLIVGAGLAATGNQVVTAVLITYAVDCYPDDSASIGMSVTFLRQA
ncbi:hypothetical protein FocTR4_00016748 [Fusarium oxysporum f. sp. cubense]|uniref:Major facilitator superfamily (MFS) profile domain-containing protein n=1 Tax=Fusarium oxysporum f. sp. cubense TaxID=61366 RepID=A0A5C6SE39_FUSOC|nr:hypothetical protein FocTR4_00016748 [Fusarium oxysporum f. sp. cubense]